MCSIIFSILCWHLYQTQTFNNNLNDGEMITSHSIFELHYKTAYWKNWTQNLGLRTRDPYVEPWTWDPQPWTFPFTWDPGSRIPKQDPGPGTFTWNLGRGTLHGDLGPGTLCVGTYYIETSPLICSDWFLYDGDLLHERVNYLLALDQVRGVIRTLQTSILVLLTKT